MIGVYGLCVVDRAEEHLRLSIKETLYCDDFFKTRLQQKVVVLGHSVEAYKQALIHQKQGHSELLCLWANVGYCADRVLSLTMEEITPDRRAINPSQIVAALGSTVKPQLRSVWEKKQGAVSAGHYRTVRLYVQAYGYFSRAAALVCLADLQARYATLFPCHSTAHEALVQSINSANDAGHCLIAAAECSAVAPSVREESDFGRLRQLVVDGYKRVADMLSPWGPAPQPQGGRRLAVCAEAVSNLVAALAPTVAQYEELLRRLGPLEWPSRCGCRALEQCCRMLVSRL